MPIPMRALKTFSGRSGESRRQENLVQEGDDFNVIDARRCNYLETRGFAAKLFKAQPKPLNKMEAAPLNKAAGEGPLPSTGGATGETIEPASLSDQGLVPRRRASRKPTDKLDL